MGEETVLTVAQATTEAPEAPAEPTGEAAQGDTQPVEDEGLIETIIDAVTDAVEEVVPGGDGEPVAEEGTATAEMVGVADDHGAADGHDAVAPEIWLVLALVALIAIAFKPARKAVLGALDDRAGRIRDELEEAQRLREDAQAALANFQRQQRDALGEAGEIIAHAQSEAERLRTHATADMEETLKRRETMAMDRIAQAEAAAVAEVRGVAVDVAIAAARDIIGGQIDKSKADALVDEAIKDLPNRLH